MFSHLLLLFYLYSIIKVITLVIIFILLSFFTNQINDILPINSAIRPLEIGVYTVGDGTCGSIISNATGLIEQNHLDTASEYNAAIFDQLYHMYIKSLKQ